MGVAERRRRERKERRDCILDAAEAVFLERGLSATTMEEIAKKAEVSKGTLYLYFQGKDELYLTIARRALSEMLERLTQAASAGAGLTRVKNMMEAHAAFAVESRDRYRVALTWLTSDYSVPDNSPGFDEYRATIACIVRLAVDTIRLGQSDGSIRDDMEPRLLSTQIWGAMLGVILVRQSDAEFSRRVPEPVDLTILVPGFISLWVDALRGPALPRSLTRPESDEVKP